MIWRLPVHRVKSLAGSMVERVDDDGHQKAGITASAANAAAVVAGREGVEAHVLQMMQATCSPTGKWSIKAAHAAHLQQGGGMSQISFSLAAGRLRDRH